MKDVRGISQKIFEQIMIADLQKYFISIGFIMVFEGIPGFSGFPSVCIKVSR